MVSRPSQAITEFAITWRAHRAKSFPKRKAPRTPRVQTTMDKIVIDGGAPLNGEIQILGAKNAALIIQCATLLGDGPTTLHHLPQLTDVHTMNRLLQSLGCEVEGHRTLSIDPRGVSSGSLEAPYEHVKTMRASVTVMGPLLARYGRARISLPGGCAIGARAIDQNLKGLEGPGALKSRCRMVIVELTAKRLRVADFILTGRTAGEPRT